MTLQDLCKYYISCIELENNTTLRVSLKNPTSFTELPFLNDAALKMSDIAVFLDSNREKENDLLIGFPILKVGEYLSPVFILHLTYNDGSRRGKRGYSIDSELAVNKDIIDRYSTNEKTENIFELRQLETELGIATNTNTLENLLGVVTLLRSIRPNWEWLDDLNPNDLRKGAIQSNYRDGILNRALLIAKEPTPYTVGLSNELAQLSQSTDQDIRHSILWKIRNNQIHSSSPEQSAIYEVLPLNTEQKEAVRTALTSDVTLIAGPPGTGKTQVVANLLINAAINGQSVLFTSKNNNAVNVVVDRVNRLNKPLPIVLRYEKSAKQCLMDYAQQWEKAKPKQQADSSYKQQYQELYQSHALHQKQKMEIIALRNKMDEMEQKTEILRDKYPQYFGALSDALVETLDQAYREFREACEQAQQAPQGILNRVFESRYKAKVKAHLQTAVIALNTAMHPFRSDLIATELMSERERTHYDLICQELISNLKQIADYNFLLRQLRESASLEQLDQMLLRDHSQLQRKATQFWNYWLDQHIRDYNPDNRQALHQYLSLLEHDKVDEMPGALRQLIPISAITSLSARRRIPFVEGFYDMLIIDEASQCDIASMIPLMMRAKRVVVIGDKQQLNHICLLNKQTDLSLMAANNIDDARWSYRANSIYDLAESVVPSECIIQLRDHHRSFMDIIQFSNQEFYDNTLRVATDYRHLTSPENEKGPVLGMQWMNVKGQTIRPDKGGAYNTREVQGIIRMLRHLTEDLHFEGSIGVTTPFHLQAEMIMRTLEGDSELRNTLELHNQILIDTVHKFQGDERDVIIFSPVVSQGAAQQSLSFLKSTGNLFNVAITRARSLLVTVGDKEYCKHCGVSYLEHFAEYSQGENAPVESSEWEHILQKALSDAGVPVTAQYHVDKYYLDLAVFHNDKKLDIEVDGAMYHQTWDNELCYNDQLRNQTLIQQGWDVRRFWVQQVRDELPWCIQQIKDWMNQK